jgi:hypothetical protein
MKSTYFHFIYCAIIAFLGYNYWSSVQAFKAFEHLNSQLTVDYGIMDNTAELLYAKFERNCTAYRTIFNAQSLNQCEMAIKANKKTLDFIKKNKVELGLIGSDYKSNSPNNSFFSNKKIDEIKSELTHLHKDLIQIFADSSDKNLMDTTLYLLKTVNDTAYWHRLKYLPLSGVVNQLSFLENQIKVDEIIIINYFSRKTESDYSIDDSYFKTAIAPKKAVLIEGESMEAEIYLAKYSSYHGNNVTIKVNGQQLEIKEGIAYFKSDNETVGTKIIKAESLVRNPLTGQTKITEGTFEYEVLPKCSRDCQ